MQNPQESPVYGPATPMLARWGVPLLALLLLCLTVISVTYALHTREEARKLEASRDEMKAAVSQTRAQLGELSAKLQSLAVARTEAAAPPAPAVRRPSAAGVPARRRAAAAADPRFKKLQDQLAEQQKQLASTQEEVRKAQEELQGKLDSTRDELSGSIARNHEELVELQKRGERNYYEFDLAKSKQFQRTGPIGLSLRKADTKHKRFDLMLMVDDLQLEKKRVNVYEPVLIYLPDRPQPLELVINQVNKNQVKGYVSEPKYKKSDLAASAAAPAKQQELTLRQR